MPYYGSNCNVRNQARSTIKHALNRFQTSLPSSTKLLNYTTTKHVKDNYDLGEIGVLLYNPFSQKDFSVDINAAALRTGDHYNGGKDLALAIAFTWYFQDFSGIETLVCERLVGLYIFSIMHMEARAIEEFLQRCPNLTSLTFAYMDVADAKFIRKIMRKGLLSNLEFLEISHCSDEAIAAMVHAPELKEIVFRFPDPAIGNEGFKRLVENGGGRNISSITGSTAEDTKYLTRNYLKAVLPKFTSGQSSLFNLKAMKAGRKDQGHIFLRINHVPLRQDTTASISVPKYGTGTNTFSNKTPLSAIRMSPQPSTHTEQAVKCKINRRALGELKVKTNKTSNNIVKKASVRKVKSRHFPSKVKVSTTKASTTKSPYAAMTVVALKGLLRQRKLKVGGLKAEIIDRLEFDDKCPVYSYAM